MPYTEQQLKGIVGAAVADALKPIEKALTRLADAEDRRAENELHRDKREKLWTEGIAKAVGAEVSKALGNGQRGRG